MLTHYRLTVMLTHTLTSPCLSLSLSPPLSRVIQSYNPSFPVGCHVVSDCGWRSHWVCDGAELTPVLPDWPQDIPLSLALGAIGMPG